MKRYALFIAMVCYSTLCMAAHSSDAGSAAAASSSGAPIREYNLQKLILPIAGDRYLGADPNYAHLGQFTPRGNFYGLWASKFDFKLSGAEVEHLGKFTHSRAFAQRVSGKLDLSFTMRFPKLVRTMTFLGDSGLLAFDKGFYDVAAAVLRANYLFVRDKAVQARRIENIPMLPDNFNDSIEGVDALPDAAMISYFYNQFEQNPPKAWGNQRNHYNYMPAETKLLESAETLPLLLRPLLEMVYARVGPYASLLQQGIGDWQQAEQELEQDMQTIEQTACSRWEKIAALKGLFYATNPKKYHNQAPIAMTHRPTDMIEWNITREQTSITVTPYCPINGALPHFFANRVRTVLSTIVNGDDAWDEENKRLITIIPSLAFDEIPPTEVVRMLHNVAVGRSIDDTERAVSNVEKTLLEFLYRCLTNKIAASIKSHDNKNLFMLDIYRILEFALRDWQACAEVRPMYGVTQRLLDVLPCEYARKLHARCADSLAIAGAIDTGDMQIYYAERALQEQKPENFHLYLSIYKHGHAPYPLTNKGIHELSSLWHFMHLVPELQKEFLLRMWHEHIKKQFEQESFVQKYGCNIHCGAECTNFIGLFRYLSGAHHYSTHDRYAARVRMLRDATQHADWLPEMLGEIVVMRRAILEKMYPRYREIMQERFKEAGHYDMVREQELLIEYIQTLDKAGCGQIMQRLQLLDAQASEQDVVTALEASLPLEMRSYSLLSPKMQQKTMRALQSRYYTLSLASVIGPIIRRYLLDR